MKNLFRFLPLISGLPRTLVFNLRYFPLPLALTFPVLVSAHVRFERLGGTVTLETPKRGCVRIGFGPGGGKTVWDNAARIVLAGTADIRQGAVIHNRGYLRIGTGFAINTDSSITCVKDVRIGAEALISSGVLIMDTDFHHMYDADGQCVNGPAAIAIADKVWIGVRSMVLKGASIPKNTIIGAGAVVCGTHSEESTVMAGVPAKIIRRNITWRR